MPWTPASCRGAGRPSDFCRHPFWAALGSVADDYGLIPFADRIAAANPEPWELGNLAILQEWGIAATHPRVTSQLISTLRLYPDTRKAIMGFLIAWRSTLAARGIDWSDPRLWGAIVNLAARWKVRIPPLVAPDAKVDPELVLRSVWKYQSPIVVSGLASTVAAPDISTVATPLPTVDTSQPEVGALSEIADDPSIAPLVFVALGLLLWRAAN